MTAPRSCDFNLLELLRSIGPCPCKCTQLETHFVSLCRPITEEPDRRTSVDGLLWESSASDNDLVGNAGGFLNRAPMLDGQSIDLGSQKINGLSATRQQRRHVDVHATKKSTKSVRDQKAPLRGDVILSQLDCARQRLLVAMEQSAESRRVCRKRILQLDEVAEVENHRKRLYDVTKTRVFG